MRKNSTIDRRRLRLAITVLVIALALMYTAIGIFSTVINQNQENLGRERMREITAQSTASSRSNGSGACHTGGVGGAPTLDHGHWDARIAQGTDTLYTHAIEGFTGAAGVMPARGGNPALTDEQMKATVDWMLANLK